MKIPAYTYDTHSSNSITISGKIDAPIFSPDKKFPSRYINSYSSVANLLFW